MNDIADPTPIIGHNNPPSPFEASEAAINDLYGEAGNWLDGEAIENQGQADELSKLLNLIRAAKREADAARKTENKPFDEGKKEVQDRYNPLLKMADLVVETCKKALAPWLEKVEAGKAAIAERARLEAEEKQREAQAAHQAANPDNLEERARAEALIEDAKKAGIVARVAAKDTAKASGGVGRAISLRTTRRPVLADPVVAARHYWQANRPAMEEFLTGLAEKDYRAGILTIPGFEIIEEKTAA